MRRIERMKGIGSVNEHSSGARLLRAAILTAFVSLHVLHLKNCTGNNSRLDR